MRGSGRVGAEWGRLGLGRGWACIGIQLNFSKTRPRVSGVGHALGVRLGPGYLATRIGQVGPRGAGLGRGRVGRAECGVGHALGFP